MLFKFLFTFLFIYLFNNQTTDLYFTISHIPRLYFNDQNPFLINFKS